MVLYPVPSSLLSFIPRALQVFRVLPTPDHVTIETEPRRASPDCPVCGPSSTRVHSGYRRHLRPAMVRTTGDDPTGCRRFRALVWPVPARPLPSGSMSGAALCPPDGSTFTTRVYQEIVDVFESKVSPRIMNFVGPAIVVRINICRDP